MAAPRENSAAMNVRLAIVIAAALGAQACARSSVPVDHPALLSTEAARIADVRHVNASDEVSIGQSAHHAALTTCVNDGCSEIPAADLRID